MFENLKSGDVVVDAHDADLVYIGRAELCTGTSFVFMNTDAKVVRFDSSGVASTNRADVTDDSVRDTIPMQTPCGVFEGATEGQEYTTEDGDTVVFVGTKPAVDEARTCHIVYDMSTNKCVSYTARGEFYEDGTPCERDIKRSTPAIEADPAPTKGCSDTPTAAPDEQETTHKPTTGLLGALLGSALGAALSQALDGDPADEYDIPLMAELIKEICRK